MSALPLVKLWLWLSALATLAGWTLSALGQLNVVGYLVFAGAAAAAAWALGRSGKVKPALRSSFNLRKLGRRFRRPLPLLFAALALLVLLGGLLHAPTNHTALSYRIPRVLHWLAEGEWFWIHTPNYRLNNRACGMEWLSAPLFLFTKSDRGLFLLNFLPFLLLPGLLFSTLTRLGVHARVAWHWMWLLPSGYVFLLQAGSAGNDTFPVVYALAAVDFACRAWSTRRAADLWHSLVAVALLTGAKASNLPLVLPWLVLVVPLLPVLKKHLATTSVVVLLAVVASFLPTAILNVVYCGDWSGLNLERAGMDMQNPVVGVWGNAFLLALNNLAPPFFPLAGWWNQNALDVLPGALVNPLVANFEQGFHLLWELPTEDWCGIGMGVTVLMIVAALVTLRRPGGGILHRNARALPALVRWLAVLTPWVALLAYCVKSGMVTPARLIAPYYPLLLPLLLLGAGQAWLVRTRAWRWLSVGTLLLAFPVLIVTPARPLWPAQTILSRAVEARPDSRLLNRALRTYSVYADRSDPLGHVRALLPADLAVVGFLGIGDDVDISFWKPYGSRRVEHILLADKPEQIRARGVDYIVVSGFHLELENTTLAAWREHSGAELLVTTNAIVKVTEGPKPWHIVRLGD